MRNNRLSEGFAPLHSKKPRQIRDVILNKLRLFTRFCLSRKSVTGFTLIELLVVISIIGILSTLLMLQIGVARGKARDVKRIADMNQIRIALELFFDSNGHYPGLTFEGVSNSGEMIGDDDGNIEQALQPYLTTIPVDPLHDGTIYYYSYDPRHCSDDPIGSCNCSGGTGAVLAFNKAESSPSQLIKQTCSGGDMNQHNADYNIVFFPPAP